VGAAPGGCGLSHGFVAFDTLPISPWPGLPIAANSDHSWEEILGRAGYSDRLLILKKPFDNIEVLQLASALTEKWRLAEVGKRRSSSAESPSDPGNDR
jgi:hypothetical protein